MNKNMIIVGVLVFFISVGVATASQYHPDWAHQGQLEVIGSDYIKGAKVALSLKGDTRKVTALWLIDAAVP